MPEKLKTVNRRSYNGSNCTFASIMKKIGFFFSISIVLGLLLSTYSYALKNGTAPDFGMAQQKRFVISTPAHVETLYFSPALLEEDNDDAGTEREKFLSGKNAFTITSFVTSHFTDNVLFKKAFTSSFFNFSQPGFIYFRVLRL